MTGWHFPPRESPEKSLQRLRELDAEADRRVSEQHLVSRVILKRFTSLLDDGSRKVGRYDVARRTHLDPKGIRGCAKVTDFVKYRSESIEKLWQAVENRLPASLTLACDRDSTLNPGAIDIIKDCIALHYVRSYRYAQVHGDSVRSAELYARHRMLTEHRDKVVREFFRVHGLWPTGDEALNIIIEEHFKPWRQREADGSLFRQSIEAMFLRVCEILQPLGFEILHAPIGSEFVISDSPAFTFNFDPRKSAVGLNMAIGDSQGVGMPLSPDCFVCVGPTTQRTVVTEENVQKLNEMQTILAHRQVYFRPDGDAGADIPGYLNNVSDTVEHVDGA
jgi:hypothetical protein